MEIAKYIGLFLLKHNSCYIPGLTKLELKRKPSVYDDSSLTAPALEIIAVPFVQPDNALANFIAANEHTSIDKAANALKEYSDHIKAAILAGNEPQLSILGNFVQVNGNIHFATNPYFGFAATNIPVEKVQAKRAGIETQYHATAYFPKPEYTPPQAPPVEEPVTDKRTNWTMIVLIVLILGMLAAGLIFGPRFINSERPAVQTDTSSKQMPVRDMAVPGVTDSTGTSDSMAIDSSANQAAITGNESATTFKVILNTYDVRSKAEKRLQRLRSYGNNVELIEEDSTMFFIVMPITATPGDKKRIMDSLANNFNPAGVTEY